MKCVQKMKSALKQATKTLTHRQPHQHKLKTDKSKRGSVTAADSPPPRPRVDDESISTQFYKWIQHLVILLLVMAVTLPMIVYFGVLLLSGLALIFGLIFFVAIVIR